MADEAVVGEEAAQIGVTAEALLYGIIQLQKKIARTSSVARP